jgi:hypothetical protein
MANPVLAQELTLDETLYSDMLPAGRQAIRAEVRYGVATERFNDSGNREKLFSGFNGLPINYVINPVSLGLPAATNFGTTQMSSRASGERLRFTYGYGINDDLTAGAVFGWSHLSNKVDYAVVGANIPNATQAVQTALSSLYGYKPVASTSTDSPIDANFGMRWRFAKGENWSTVLTPVLRLGLAKPDDPDNLVDLQLEDGSNDLQLALEHFRQWPGGWELWSGVQYTHSLPDHIRARPFAAGALSLVPQANTENLRRQLGDAWAVDFQGGRRIGNWYWFSRLQYSGNSATDYSSARGQDVSGLEAGTAGFTLKGWLGVSWSGIRGYLAEHHGLPAIVTLQYETLLDGRNAVKTDNLHLSLTLPF